MRDASISAVFSPRLSCHQRRAARCDTMKPESLYVSADYRSLVDSQGSITQDARLSSGLHGCCELSARMAISEPRFDQVLEQKCRSRSSASVVALSGLYTALLPV